MYETEQAQDPVQPRRLAYPMRIVSPVVHFSRRSLVAARERMAPVRNACDLTTMTALGALIATIVLELTLVMAPWLAMISVALGFFVIARVVASRRKPPCSLAELPLKRVTKASRPS